MTVIDTSAAVKAEVVARTAAVTGWRVHPGPRTSDAVLFYPTDTDSVVRAVQVVDGDEQGQNVEINKPLDSGSILSFRTYTLWCWYGPVDDNTDTYNAFRVALGVLRDSFLTDPILANVATLSAGRLPEIGQIVYDPLEQFVVHLGTMVIETVAEEHWR